MNKTELIAAVAESSSNPAVEVDSYGTNSSMCGGISNLYCKTGGVTADTGRADFQTVNILK